MADRDTRLNGFLSDTGWRHAKRSHVAGDASNRRYDRMTRDDATTAILMDAPPELGEDVRPFCEMAEFLISVGLSAPQIFHSDAENGFLIIEDLGNDLFARAIPNAPELETPLYAAATDVLSHLHAQQPPQLTPFDCETMADMVDLGFSWYANGAGIDWQTPFDDFQALFPDLLSNYVAPPSVFMHRDYHAENLLWLPGRAGVARVGILDFQDAKLAHPAYDLVSMLQDARRDVPADLEQAMIARYVTASGEDHTAFSTAYHVLGAQRNLRILGVFARLCLHFGKPHYVDFIPRVYGLLMRDLAHPALTPVADILRRTLPEPTSSVLKNLKDRCATFPTP